MRGAWDRPAQRALRLLAGLVLFGLALAVLIEAGLGVDPWTVFNQGIAENTGVTIGEATIISSIGVLLLWIPLGQRPGVGTVANAIIVGPVIDLGLGVVPAADGLAVQGAYAAGAIVGVAIATGLYVGAGWGPGPRDGLMTGLAGRGVPLAVARGGVEVTVLVLGWLLGGTVGVATVAFALAIGPLVRRALGPLSLAPVAAPEPEAPRAAPAACAAARSARR